MGYVKYIIGAFILCLKFSHCIGLNLKQAFISTEPNLTLIALSCVCLFLEFVVFVLCWHFLLVVLCFAVVLGRLWNMWSCLYQFQLNVSTWFGYRFKLLILFLIIHMDSPLQTVFCCSIRADMPSPQLRLPLCNFNMISNKIVGIALKIDEKQLLKVIQGVFLLVCPKKWPSVRLYVNPFKKV